jgi:hypothetical protein
MAAEALTPWVVLADTAFRVISTRTTADSIVVRAAIRNRRVAELIDDYSAARSDLSYAGAHDSALVRIKGVSAESTSAGSQTLEITMARVAQTQASTVMSVNRVSADDVTERVFRGALFGEPVDIPFWGLGTVQNPLQILRGRGLPDAVVRSLARVLVDEALRQQGIKGGASKFTLGPAKAGGRLLDLSWFPPRRYSNEPTPAERTITGTVPTI